VDLTGKISGLGRAYESGKPVLSFEVDEEPVGIEELKDVELAIKITKKRGLRSLDSNAYFHVLRNKLADALRLSKPRMKNILIGRYGQPEMIDGVQVETEGNIPPDFMLEQESLHCTYLGMHGNNHRYRINRGSHTYDTREMSILIDGTIEECKAQGIETATPDQLARMAALWEQRREREQ